MSLPTTNEIDKGFTLLELLVAILVLGVILAIAIPHLNTVHAQLTASEDLRAIARKFQQLRAEAVRTRQLIQINVSTDQIDWDYGADSSVEGSYHVHTNNSISGNLPASFTFNGMGLARGINGTKTLTVGSTQYSLSVQMNSNGYIKF